MSFKMGKVSRNSQASCVELRALVYNMLASSCVFIWRCRSTLSCNLIWHIFKLIPLAHILVVRNQTYYNQSKLGLMQNM